MSAGAVAPLNEHGKLQFVLDTVQHVLAAAQPAEAALKNALRKSRELRSDSFGRAEVARRVMGLLCLRAKLDYVLQQRCQESPALRSADRLAALLALYILHEEPAFLAAKGLDSSATESSSALSSILSSEAVEVLQQPLQSIVWPEAPVDRLAAEFSLPQWLAELWVRELGVQTACCLAAATNVPGGVHLRCRASRQQLTAALSAEGWSVQAGPLCPWALHITAPAKPNIWGCAAYNRGDYEVQDEGSQLIALAVGAKPGQLVVDLCAGRGGKALALAQAMLPNGRVIAHDIDSRALQDLKVNTNYYLALV
jgi:16S rRNA (cytosine967-C5)-methyltransferase